MNATHKLLLTGLALTWLAFPATSLAIPAIAQAQTPEPARPSQTSNQQAPAPAPAEPSTPQAPAPVPAEPTVAKPSTFSQNQKIMYAAMSAGMPGVGQIFEKRYLPGYYHLGGAVALGVLTLGGWYYNVGALQMAGAIGLTGLSAYSAWDAFFAVPPQVGISQ